MEAPQHQDLACPKSLYTGQSLYPLLLIRTKYLHHDTSTSNACEKRQQTNRRLNWTKNDHIYGFINYQNEIITLFEEILQKYQKERQNQKTLNQTIFRLSQSIQGALTACITRYIEGCLSTNHFILLMYYYYYSIRPRLHIVF